MNIAENLALLQNTKSNIYQAIIAVGGDLSSGAPFSAYSEAILVLDVNTGTTPDTGETPTPEPVYTYAMSMDGGSTFATGDLDGSWDDSIGNWARNYLELHYGSGDWANGDFVSSGVVPPSNYAVVDDPIQTGIQDYDIGYDDDQGQWFVSANSNTVQYDGAGEFLCVKAQSGNTDISGATMHLEISSVDADPNESGGGDELPMFWYKFDSDGNPNLQVDAVIVNFDPEGQRYQSRVEYCYDTYADIEQGEEMPTPVSEEHIDYDSRFDSAQAQMNGAGGSTPWVRDCYYGTDDCWHVVWELPTGTWYLYNDMTDVVIYDGSLRPNN